MLSSTPGARSFRSLTAISLALLAAVTGVHAQLAEDPLEPIVWRKLHLFPSLTLIFEGDDNVRRTNETDPFLEPISSGVRDVAPQIRLEVPLEKSRWDLSYRAQFRDYTAVELRDANGVSHFVDASVSFPVAPSSRLEVTEHYVRGRTELLEVDPGGELRFGTQPFVTESTRVVLGIQAGPVQKIEAGATFDSSRFEPEGGVGFQFNTDGTGFFALYSISTSPVNGLFVAADYQQVNQDRGSLEFEPTDYSRAALGGGIRRQMSAGMTSEFRAAYTTSRFEDDDEPPFRGVTLEGSLNSRIGSGGAVGVRMRRTPRPSYFNSNAYYVNEMAQLVVQQRLGQRLVLQVEGTLQTNRYPQAVRVAVSTPADMQFDQDGDGLLDPFEFLLPSEGIRRRDHLRSASAQLSVRVLRGVRVNFGYRRDGVNSNLSAELDGRRYRPFDYTSHEATATVTLGWP